MRKNAAGQARDMFMQKNSAKDGSDSQAQLGAEDIDETVHAVKDQFQKFEADASQRLEAHEFKLKQLMPLVQASQEAHGPAPTVNPIKEMEKKLNSRLKTLDDAQTEVVKQMQLKLNELDKAFKEKIRRQALVAAAQQRTPSPENDDARRSVRRRPKHFAEQITKELVMNGRLPEFHKTGDHIARYGKGFSQILGIASPKKETS